MCMHIDCPLKQKICRNKKCGYRSKVNKHVFFCVNCFIKEKLEEEQEIFEVELKHEYTIKYQNQQSYMAPVRPISIETRVRGSNLVSVHDFVGVRQKSQFEFTLVHWNDKAKNIDCRLQFTESGLGTWVGLPREFDLMMSMRFTH